MFLQNPHERTIPWFSDQGPNLDKPRMCRGSAIFLQERIYYKNYQVLNSSGNSYNCMQMYARMLAFCITAFIYYIIINAAYPFI